MPPPLIDYGRVGPQQPEEPCFIWGRALLSDPDQVGNLGWLSLKTGDQSHRGPWLELGLTQGRTRNQKTAKMAKTLRMQKIDCMTPEFPLASPF